MKGRVPVKKLLALFLAVIMVFSCAACSQQEESSAGDPGKKDGKVTLGISFASLDALYFQAQKDRAEKAAGELGFEAIISVADNDSGKQLQQCEDMLTKATSTNYSK